MAQSQAVSLFEQAVAMHQAGRVEEAASLYEGLYQKDKKNPDLLNLLGLCYTQLGKTDKALPLLERAVKIDPKYPDYRLNYAAALRNAKEFAEAEENLRVALKLDPQNWRVQLSLGNAILQQEKIMNADRADEAESYFNYVLERQPGVPQAMRGLANIYFNRGKFKEARILYEQYADQQKDQTELDALTALALSWEREDEIAKAEQIMRQAVLRPDAAADTFFIHGHLLSKLELKDLAIIALKKALKLNPDHFQSRIRLTGIVSGYATIHQDYHEDFLEQIRYYESKPEMQKEIDVYLNLLIHYTFTCAYDKVAALTPLFDYLKEEERAPTAMAVGLTGLVNAKDDEYSQKFFTFIRRCMGKLEKDIEPFYSPDKPRIKNNKIRIGLLSGDLRTHSVVKFVMPLLSGYDRDIFEFYGYSTMRNDADQTQQYIKSILDGFYNADTLSEKQVAEMIFEHNIDILFDLTGFTMGTKIGALAYKPAPVQISWLGYPFSTGLERCDYILVDRFMKPENDLCMIEKPLVLPKAGYYWLEQHSPLPITETLPVEKNGYVTFGTLNNVYKYTPHTLDLWCEILRQTPNSKLRIIRPDFKRKYLKDNLLKALTSRGIDESRIEIMVNQYPSHLEHYNDFDLSLDSLPLTGGTTTTDLLWMGVPLITMVGGQLHQRISYSILNQIGAPELCATNDQEYISKAVQLAGDVTRLRYYRKNLRQMMQDSPLCRNDIFLKDFTETMTEVAKRHNLK
ncbi:MAG: tetratricopeptide repeat protein [Dongiaceae bacterium]